jgi:predicted N-acetyltransferase YhbS
MTVSIRQCAAQDLPAVVEILEEERGQLSKYEPRLWKQAPTSREMTGPFFESLLATGKHVFLVAEEEGDIIGFLLASPMPVPPIYDAPTTAIIDDFAVSDSTRWEEVGGLLVQETRKRLKERGVVQFIFIGPQRHTKKMDFLRAQGLSEHASWFNDAV